MVDVWGDLRSLVAAAAWIEALALVESTEPDLDGDMWNYLSAFMARATTALEARDQAQFRVEVLRAHLVPHTIIQRVPSPVGKLSIDLRLKRRATLAELHKLAALLHDPTFQRHYILAYLPGQTVGNGAWARMHYTPELDVAIQESLLTMNPTSLDS